MQTYLLAHAICLSNFFELLKMKMHEHAWKFICQMQMICIISSVYWYVRVPMNQLILRLFLLVSVILTCNKWTYCCDIIQCSYCTALFYAVYFLYFLDIRGCSIKDPKPSTEGTTHNGRQFHISPVHFLSVVLLLIKKSTFCGTVSFAVQIFITFSVHAILAALFCCNRFNQG